MCLLRVYAHKSTIQMYRIILGRSETVYPFSYYQDKVMQTLLEILEKPTSWYVHDTFQGNSFVGVDWCHSRRANTCKQGVLWGKGFPPQALPASAPPPVDWTLSTVVIRPRQWTCSDSLNWWSMTQSNTLQWQEHLSCTAHVIMQLLRIGTVM